MHPEITHEYAYLWQVYPVPGMLNSGYNKPIEQWCKQNHIVG